MPSRLPVLRIGVISDTHGLLRPEVEGQFAGVAHIIHGGDIGSPDIVAGLERTAPVIAIRGNVDTGRWADAYPETRMITLGGCRIYVVHDIKTLQLDPVASGVDPSFAATRTGPGSRRLAACFISIREVRVHDVSTCPSPWRRWI